MGTCWSVLSYHGSTLAADAGGQIGNVLPDGIGTRHVVYLYRPSSAASACFLFCPALDRSVALELRPQQPLGHLLPLRVTRPDAGGYVSLYSPETGAYLTMAPPSEESGEGGLALGATELKEWEQITLQRAPADDFVLAYSATFGLLDELFEASSLSRGIAQAVMGRSVNPVSRPILEAAGIFLSESGFRSLAREAVGAGDDFAKALAALFAGNIAACHAVPAVLAWLDAQSTDKAEVHSRGTAGFFQRLFRGSRRHHGHDGSAQDIKGAGSSITIGPEIDGLDQDSLFIRYRGLAENLNFFIRDSVEPRKRTCIVTSVRNEGLYLLEWVAYHRILGFDKIFIYSNDNSDGSDALLKALSEHHEIFWIDNRVKDGVRAQSKAFSHALRLFPDALDYEWTLIIDLDEFFLPHRRFGTVSEFLDWHESRPVDAIAINWRMVGPNGQTHWHDDLLLRRFPKGRSQVDQHIKSMFRTKKFIHSFPHDPTAPWGEAFVFRNADGDEHRYDGDISRGIALNPSEETAEILHFFFKSNEEMIWKASRNRGDDPRAQGLHLSGLHASFIASFVSEEARSDRDLAIGHLVEKLDAEVARLLSHSTVRAAWDQVKVNFRGQIPALLEQARAHPVMAAAGESGQSFLAAFEDVVAKT